MLIPPALIAAPFVVAGPAYGLWVFLVLLAVGGLGWAGLVRLREPGPAGYAVRGPVLAVLIATTVLLELGALLAVRLVVVPDPSTPLAAAGDAEHLNAAWSALGQPVLGLAIVIFLVAGLGGRTLGGRTLGGRTLGGRTLGRWAAWARRGDLPERPRGYWTVLAVVFTAIPFLAPLFSGGGGASLTVAHVATPEYGKLLLCAALAYVVARDSYRFQGVRLFAALGEIRRAAPEPWRRPPVVAYYRASRFLLLPVCLFGVVAVASGVRHDFGTVVPAALATMGVTWCATRLNLDGDRVAGEPARRVVRLITAYRLFIGAAVLLIAAAIALFTTDYIGERGRVWNDPWRFRWDAPCAVVAAPAEVIAPVGRVPCLRSLAANTESEDSQLARAIAATADGGLWGRGLRDRVSAAVPAGATDFILAIIWNKLGALVVIFAGLMITVLSAGLVRVAAMGSAAGRASPLLLFAAGLGAMTLGQFLFVLAATANVVPHTGIPAPLLSRGGQSTLALGIGVALVLAAARAGGEPPPPAPSVARLRLLTPALTTAIMVVIVAALTLVPYAAPRLADPKLPMAYGQRRPLCASRTADLAGLTASPPDPRTCSTDLIALARTRLAVTFPGGGRLILDRASGRWTPDRSGPPAGLVPEDLGDLLAPSGPLLLSYPKVTQVSAGTTLRERLTPARRDRVDGGFTLTLDPARQHEIAVAVRGLHGVTAGVVILDAVTGRVLVSAATTATAEGAEVGAGADLAFLRAHPYWVRPDGEGRVVDTTRDGSCRPRSRDGAGQDDCWRWSYTEPAHRDGADAALGRDYPYGGALAPLFTASAGPGDSAGQVRRVGLRVGGCSGPDLWAAVPLAGSVASCVPDPADPGGARGTPLTLAVLASAVANGGQAVHPRIVENVRYPATGLTVRSPGPPPSPAFAAATADRLAAAHYPTSGGLHLMTTDVEASGGTGAVRWVNGFNNAGTLAFAVVVEGPGAGPAADRLTAAVRTSIGGRG